MHRICSSFVNFKSEIQKFKSVLANNRYPVSVVDRCIQNFMCKINNPKPKPLTVPQLPVFIVLPYLGAKSMLLKRRLLSLFKSSLPQVKCDVVFKAPCRLSQWFPFKDRVPKCLLARVVYKFTCSGCNSTYYGKTSRHLQTRACEHLKISNLTGKPRKYEQVSAIFDHVSKENHNASVSDFSVLHSASSDRDLLILESLLIAKDRPNLNNNIGSLPLKLF